MDYLLRDVFVPGRPKTKGSMEHIGRGRMRESVIGSTAWRRLVAHRIVELRAGTPAPLYADVVSVELRFQFAHLAEPPHSRQTRLQLAKRDVGDLDKLVRNILDALTDAQVYRDDSQVVDLMATKHLVNPVDQGVNINVWRI